MGTAIKHRMLDRVKPSFVIFDTRALWRSALRVAKLFQSHGPATAKQHPYWQLLQEVKLVYTPHDMSSLHTPTDDAVVRDVQIVTIPSISLILPVYACITSLNLKNDKTNIHYHTLICAEQFVFRIRDAEWFRGASIQLLFIHSGP